MSVSFLSSQNEEVDKKYAGLLEKKWTSVIRLQKKVRNVCVCSYCVFYICLRRLIQGAQFMCKADMSSAVNVSMVLQQNLEMSTYKLIRPVL